MVPHLRIHMLLLLLTRTYIGKLRTKLAVLEDMLQRGKELYRGAGKSHNYSKKYDTDDEY